MRFGTCALLLLAACGSVQNPTPAGDDDTIIPGDDDMPPADQPDAGTPDPDAPPAPLAIEVIATSIKDERGDAVTFTTGVPHHVHAGAAVALGGSECPDVFKYAYLLDTAAPAFGSEDAANPLVFRFRANNLSIGEYRVRTPTATLLDWTAAAADGEQFVAELHRDGSRKIADLGTTEDDYFIDMRVRNATQESVATACWKHHPMAAPVEVTPLVAATDASISALTLANDGFLISSLIDGSGLNLYEARITHATAEATRLHLELAMPRATFTKLGVVDIVPISKAVAIACGTTCGHVIGCTPQPPTDARCKAVPATDPSDSAITGTLTPGGLEIQILNDDLVLAPECKHDGSGITCTFPARATTAPPTTLLLRVVASGFADVRPGDGTIGQQTLAGGSYVGLPPKTIDSHCGHFTVGTPSPTTGQATVTCDTLVTDFEITALDSLIVDFDPTKLQVSTGFSSGVLSTVAYAPGGIEGSALHWDAGIVDLPGPSH